MSTHATLDLRSLKQLQAISAEMYAYAELGDWDAVLNSDHKRLQILKKPNDNGLEGITTQSRKLLIDEILDFDLKIMELANNERQLVLDEELRQQAQVAAQTGYKQALTSDTGI